MQRHDFDRQCAKIMATWQTTLPEATRAEWYEQMRQYDAGHLAATVQKLAVTSDRKPTLAQLIAGCRSMEARERRPGTLAHNHDPEALPEGVVAVIETNYGAWAVEGRAPWRLSETDLGRDFPDCVIYEVQGVPPIPESRPAPRLPYAEPIEATT